MSQQSLFIYHQILHLSSLAHGVRQQLVQWCMYCQVDTFWVLTVADCSRASDRQQRTLGRQQSDDECAVRRAAAKTRTADVAATGYPPSDRDTCTCYCTVHVEYAQSQGTKVIWRRPHRIRLWNRDSRLIVFLASPRVSTLNHEDLDPFSRICTARSTDWLTDARATGSPIAIVVYSMRPKMMRRCWMTAQYLGNNANHSSVVLRRARPVCGWVTRWLEPDIRARSSRKLHKLVARRHQTNDIRSGAETARDPSGRVPVQSGELAEHVARMLGYITLEWVLLNARNLAWKTYATDLSLQPTHEDEPGDPIKHIRHRKPPPASSWIYCGP